jgi:hypothetical protein
MHRISFMRVLLAIRFAGLLSLPVWSDEPRNGSARQSSKAKPSATSQESQPPRLELRIVANEYDDAEAFKLAKEAFLHARRNDRSDTKPERDGAQLPVPPRPPDGKAFVTRMGRLTYSWAHTRKDVFLLSDEASKRVDEARAHGEPIVLSYTKVMLYSRANARHKATDGGEDVDYFVLLRDPEKGKAITETSMREIKVGADSAKYPAVDIILTKQGGNLLSEMTKANNRTDPLSDPFRRKMAVLLNGRVVEASSICGTIETEALIVFPRSESAEVEKLVKSLSQALRSKK